MCEQISPISPEKCPPHIPGCEETIKNIAYSKAHELYGDPLPEIVQDKTRQRIRLNYKKWILSYVYNCTKISMEIK